MVFVKDILEKIKLSGNLEEVFWYQNLILKVILKIIFILVEEHLNVHYNLIVENNKHKTDVIPDEIMKEFETLKEHKLFGNTNFLNTLNICISILVNAHSFGNSNLKILRENLNEYNKTLLNDIDIHWDLFTRPGEDGKRTKVCQMFMKMPIKTFTSLLASKMKCFNQLFQLLKYECNKYNNLEKLSSAMENAFCGDYDDSLSLIAFVNINNTNDLKFIKNPNPKTTKSKEVTTDNTICNEGCDFIGGLYEHCFEIIVIINDDLPEKLTEIHKILFLIKEYLLIVVEKYTNERFREIASYTISFIQFTGEILLEQYNVAIAKRFALAIMTELNYYRLEHCNPPGYNYFSFNNIQFDNFGMHTIIEDKWESFLK